MNSLLSKGKLVAILRNEGKWELLVSLYDSFKIERFSYKKSINKLLKELSSYYHCNIIENKKLISDLYGIKQKVPILIQPNNILLFQTTSFDHPKCILLNYFYIHKYRKMNNYTYVDFCVPYKNTKIILNDGIYIPCDRRTIHNQFKRCLEIEKTLRERNII